MTPDSHSNDAGPLAGPARPRAVQYFSPEYLEQCKAFSAEDIVRFLEEFKRNYYAAQAARTAASKAPAGAKCEPAPVSRP